MVGLIQLHIRHLTQSLLKWGAVFKQALWELCWTHACVLATVNQVVIFWKNSAPLYFAENSWNRSAGGKRDKHDAVNIWNNNKKRKIKTQLQPKLRLQSSDFIYQSSWWEIIGYHSGRKVSVWTQDYLITAHYSSSTASTALIKAKTKWLGIWFQLCQCNQTKPLLKKYFVVSQSSLMLPEFAMNFFLIRNEIAFSLRSPTLH